MRDFKDVYHGTRCLFHHCDPYNQSELIRFYQTEPGESGSDSIQRRQAETLYVNLPPTFLLVAPFAILPLGLASAIWMLLTAASIILAAVLTLDLGADYAPIISGGLIALLLANSAVVLANGNPAGIVIGLCVIAVWSFLKERFVLAGILCLSVSLAMKPHDAGLIWLFFLFAGRVYRKRALQTLAVTLVLALAATLWVSRVAPNWMPELRSNLAEISAHGGNNDPGPAGLTSKSRTPEVITDLQAAVSVFRDDPRLYDSVSYVVCGTLLLVWSIAAFQSRPSPTLTCFALAAVAPLAMLVIYHRAYDAKLLLLTVPASAILWAEGGRIARVALLVCMATLVFTGEIPLAILFSLTKKLHPDNTSVFGKIETVALMRLAPMFLLVMSIVYLWIYVRRTHAESTATEP
ncbi:MAG: glycosyltransferase family 87 protein [Terracidiphilus sp.]